MIVSAPEHGPSKRNYLVEGCVGVFNQETRIFEVHVAGCGHSTGRAYRYRLHTVHTDCFFFIQYTHTYYIYMQYGIYVALLHV